MFLSFKENITLVSFACKATGSPPPVVTWLKNNSTQANATVVEADGMSWLILLLVKNDENSFNKYNCFARNLVGKAYSNEATVIKTQTSFPDKGKASFTNSHHATGTAVRKIQLTTQALLFIELIFKYTQHTQIRAWIALSAKH